MRSRRAGRQVFMLAMVMAAILSVLAGWTVQCCGAETHPLEGGDSSPSREASDTRVQRALDYLKGRQQPDGGFAEPRQGSSDQLTAWVVMAIRSSGGNASSWKKSGKSPIDFLRSRAGGWKKLTDIERGCMAAATAGADPRSFGGRNLVSDIRANISPDGRIGDMLNEHIWGVIALRSAGEQLPDACRSWLVARQNIDGGFSFSEGAASDPDDTGAALQALVAAGERPDGPAVDRALKYLKFCQASDGGFCWRSKYSNVASTSWAVQGIVAAGQDPDGDYWIKSGKTPLGYIASMQQEDGHVRYMADSDSQPAWMTAEAVPALLKRAFPLSEVRAPDPTTTDKLPAGNETASTTSEETPSSSDGSAGSAGELPPGEEGAASASLAGGSPGDSGPAAAGPGAAGSKRSPTSTVRLAFLIICFSYAGLLLAVYFSLKLFLEPWKNPGSFSRRPGLRAR